MHDTTFSSGSSGYATEDRGGKKFQKVQTEGSDGHSMDAFGRWRGSNPKTIFDSKLLHGDSEPLLWDEELISGTMATSGPTADKPFIDFTSTNTTAGRRVRQTFIRFNYQPGKSQMIVMTGVLELASGVKTGCQRRIGIFDDDNGAFFESDAGAIGVTVRTNDTSSPVDTTVAQSSWNLDTMDGVFGPGNFLPPRSSVAYPLEPELNVVSCIIQQHAKQRKPGLPRAYEYQPRVR